jgi:hypothetical protein
MSKNQKGFSAVEGLLIFIIVAIIAGVGWYVWDSNKKTNDILSSADKSSNVKLKASQPKDKSEQTDETANWLLFKASNGKYSIKIPDGWNLVSLDGGSSPYALKSENINYKQGIPATVGPSKDKEVVVAVFVMGSPTFTGHEPNGPKAKEYKTKSGFQVTQYKYYYADEGTGVPKGSTEYEYSVQDGAKKLQIVYIAEPNTPDQLTYIEKAIETAKLY